MALPTVTVRIPGRFADDHESRALRTGTLIRTTRTVTVFECDTDDLDEWLDDADWYADPSGPGEFDTSLRNSAKATLRAVRKAVAAAGGTVDRRNCVTFPEYEVVDHDTLGPVTVATEPYGRCGEGHALDADGRCDECT